MNARFYDPQTARFLTQDTYSGNPYDPWTQHLYAYCGNNPTTMIDPTGHAYMAAHDPTTLIDPPKTQIPSSMRSGGSGMIPSSMRSGGSGRKKSWSMSGAKSIVDAMLRNEEIRNLLTDIRNYDINNQSAKNVLHSEYFSVYKGTSVIRHSIPGMISWAIGKVIFLNRNLEGTEDEQIRTVQHEYGHIMQEQRLGTLKYIAGIAIPSIIGFNKGLTGADYYSQPWEASADFFGGAERGENYYNPDTRMESYVYFMGLMGTLKDSSI